MNEPGFSRTRLACDDNKLAGARRSQFKRSPQRREFVSPVDERRQSPRGCHLPTGAGRGVTDDSKQVDRLANPLHGDLPERLAVDETHRHPHHVGRAVNCAGRGHLLHTRRQMHGWTDGIVVDRKIVMDGANEHITGVQADPNGDVRSTSRANILLYVQGCVGGAHRVVLVRNRRTEQGHDPVALHPVDGALVAADGVDHRVERRTQPQFRFFRVEVLDQIRRTLDVSEQNRDLLALTFKQGTRVQNTPLQLLRKSNRRRRVVRILVGASCAATLGRRAALAAKAVRKRDGSAATGTRLDQSRSAIQTLLALCRVRGTAGQAIHENNR